MSEYNINDPRNINSPYNLRNSNSPFYNVEQADRQGVHGGDLSTSAYQVLSLVYRTQSLVLGGILLMSLLMSIASSSPIGFLIVCVIGGLRVLGARKFVIFLLVAVCVLCLPAGVEFFMNTLKSYTGDGVLFIISSLGCLLVLFFMVCYIDKLEKKNPKRSPWKTKNLK